MGNLQSSLDGNSDRHQTRFVSSPQFQRGLSALVVSQRCAFLAKEDADEIPLIWMLQQRSWHPGGLREVAFEMLQSFNECINFHRLRFVGMDPLAWLANHLERACIDPGYSLYLSDDPYWRGDFLTELFAYRQEVIARATGKLCSTEVSEGVFEALDHALESPGSMTLCYGEAGLGKTAPARQWCDMRPGAARYIEVPGVQNDRGFYSAIAEE